MSENARLPARSRRLAADPAAGAASALDAAAGAAAHRSAGRFPPRLEIAPLTIRLAASFEIERGAERRPVC